MTESQNPTPDAPVTVEKRPPIRWWPVPIILLLAIVAVIWVRWTYEVSHQHINIYTAQVVIYTGMALLLWVLFFSRLRWKVRLSIFVGVVGPVLLAAALFKIRGVTGDLLPVLEWRWKGPQAISAPAARLATSGPISPVPTTPIAPSSQDYPQFLGPRRDGTVTGPALARDWKARPPERLWRQPIGTAWSGFAISGGHAVTQEQRGSNEMVVCYELMSGQILWSHADEARYFSTLAGEGPRATPTIVSNRVYTLGATGILNCLDLATGRRIWWTNILQMDGKGTPGWGMSGSPLVLDDQVVVSRGGPNDRSLLALHKETGEFTWGGGNDGASYSSPFLALLAGVRQILIFNSGTLAAHDSNTGKLLWEHPWPKDHPHIAVPVVLPGDRVLISSGYGIGSALLQVRKDAAGQWSASQLWKSIRLKSKFANIIHLDGFIYGLDDGIMVCLGAEDGSLKWKEGRYGHGQMILTGRLLLVMAENGDVVLLEPLPRDHLELTRFAALRGKTWNPPALAGRILLVRNDTEAACYRMPVAEP